MLLSAEHIYFNVSLQKTIHADARNFFLALRYLAAICSIDIIAGDFNDDLLKAPENKLWDIFTDHVQMANKPTPRPCIYQETFDGRIFHQCNF